MKKITTILALVSALTLSLAADAKIDAQIERIQNASASEKVELMNKFKQQLMTMNKEQRQEAVAKMQAEMQAAGEMTQAQTQERKQVREAQEDATGAANRHQHQHQKQMGSQFKATDPSSIIIGGNTPGAKKPF